MSFTTRVISAGVRPFIKVLVDQLNKELQLNRSDIGHKEDDAQLTYILDQLRRWLSTPAHVTQCYDNLQRELISVIYSKMTWHKRMQFGILLGCVHPYFHAPIPELPPLARYLEAEAQRFAKRRFAEGGEELLAAYAICIIKLRSAL